MNESKNQKFYIKLRKNVNDWMQDNINLDSKYRDYILVVPDIFYLLIQLVQDPDVPQNKKVKLVASIAYFISPFDIMPEAILGPVGYLDDLALATYVLNDLVNTIDPQIIRRNWVGDTDILITIKKVLVNVDNLIGKGVWQKVKRMFS